MEKIHEKSPTQIGNESVFTSLFVKFRKTYPFNFFWSIFLYYCWKCVRTPDGDGIKGYVVVCVYFISIGGVGVEGISESRFGPITERSWESNTPPRECEKNPVDDM